MLKLVLSLFILVTCVKAEPIHLRTNALEDPLGIDTPNPTFSWQSDAKTTNWTQSAYEVLVSTEAKNLRSGKAGAWDSGGIKPSDPVRIAYAGAGLKPQQRYVWTV